MDADTIDTMLNDVNASAMAWYTAITQKPAIPPTATPEQARVQILASQAPNAPLATVLASQPTFTWIGIAAVAVVVILLLKS